MNPGEGESSLQLEGSRMGVVLMHDGSFVYYWEEGEWLTAGRKSGNVLFLGFHFLLQCRFFSVCPQKSGLHKTVLKSRSSL